jgi:deazaflavin-dependent oxidoreductase (nitroreductase family)
VSDLNDWNRAIIEEFRANAGKVGGQFEGAPVLLLHTTGRRSGAERVNPLMYLEFEGRRFIFASAAGADHHPDWYLNLVAEPKITAEIGAELVELEARSLEEAERRRIYDEQASRYPGFREYEEKTSRVIPVVELLAR